jgi:hypothetical protein
LSSGSIYNAFSEVKNRSGRDENEPRNQYQ